MSAPTPDDGTAARLLGALPDAVTDVDVARWCGVDRTLVCHWRSGARSMPAWAVKRIARRLADPLPFIGELVAPLGLAVIRDDAVHDFGDPLGLSFDAAEHLVELQRRVASAQADSRIDAGEAHDVHEAALKLREVLQRVGSSCRARLVRRPA